MCTFVCVCVCVCVSCLAPGNCIGRNLIFLPSESLCCAGLLLSPLTSLVITCHHKVCLRKRSVLTCLSEAQASGDTTLLGGAHLFWFCFQDAQWHNQALLLTRTFTCTIKYDMTNCKTEWNAQSGNKTGSLSNPEAHTQSLLIPINCIKSSVVVYIDSQFCHQYKVFSGQLAERSFGLEGQTEDRSHKNITKSY